MIALAMRGQWKALRTLHWLSMGIGGRVLPLHVESMGSAWQGGAMHGRPDHEVTMASASHTSLSSHGHRRTRSAAPCHAPGAATHSAAR